MICPGVTHVAVAVITDQQRRVLISKRPDHVHQGGKWEFPGGKLEDTESVESALARELQEELGITPLEYRPLMRFRHDYPDKSVFLDVWIVSAFSGEPHGKEDQTILWKAIDELDTEAFPEANTSIVKAVRLPSHHLITGRFENIADFERRLNSALETGIRLVQLRLKQQWLDSNSVKSMDEVIAVSRRLCRRFNAMLMFNLASDAIMPDAGEGIHLSSRRLMQAIEKPHAGLVSASCHDERELDHAEKLGLDFALLSPVQQTSSHPCAVTLGWDKFRALSDTTSMPVYALGGMSLSDMERSWQQGAQGIAAISAFWD
jgi:8-oxo-dGTP diphosphatase